jgi:cytochrome c-type biogenesis protein CcsB
MMYQVMYVFYLLAGLTYGAGIVFAIKQSRSTTKRLSWAAFFFLLAGFLTGMIMMASTWIEMGQPPFRTLYQSLIFFSVTTVVVYLFAGKRSILLGFGTSLFILAVLAYGYIRRDTGTIYLPPALQSFWFVPHVLVYFLGYSALFISFVASVFQLVFPKPRQLPAAELLGIKEINFNAFTYRAVVFGFAMISSGLIMGALWAKFAWGDWWSWDPKENWALITWFIYAGYLHLRFIPEVKAKALSWVSVVGFLVLMFTYLGVNYLPMAQDTLHSYQNEYMNK